MSEESMSKEEIRTMIQVALGVRPMEISEISNYLGASQAAVEKNLKYLQELGKAKKEIKEIEGEKIELWKKEVMERCGV